MTNYPEVIRNLIDSFSRLPTIGPKTAERMVFYLLKQESAITNLTKNLIDVKKNITRCDLCHDFSLNNPCLICQAKDRDDSLLCVVTSHQDLTAIEKSKTYKGKYFVLEGLLEPSRGQGPIEIDIPMLINRIKQNKKIREIILALNSDLSGETTLLYMQKLLKPLNVKITRLARGLPVGADLEYADEITLSEALKFRREI